MRLSPYQLISGTALHASKDFAVSPLQLPAWLFLELLRGSLLLSLKASLLAPLTLRRTGVTRYPAPGYPGRVRTFLHDQAMPTTAIIIQEKLYNYYYIITSMPNLRKHDPISLRYSMSSHKTGIGFNHVACWYWRCETLWIGVWIYGLF